MGEYANLRKKVERGDMSLEEALPKLRAELADVIIYLDLLASQMGIDLGQAVMDTWNAKSEKLDIPLYIDAEDWHWKKGQAPP
jgi:NTP pyrophosphatase (non-canonical NTP hydrolase)